MRTVVLSVILIISTIRTLSYAVYEINDKNIIGGASLIFLTLLFSISYIIVF